MLKALTGRQSEILAYIHGKLTLKEPAPTVQEIQQEFGFGSPNAVQSHLTALEKKGFIRRVERQARGLRLTDAGRKMGKASPITERTDLAENRQSVTPSSTGGQASITSKFELGAKTPSAIVRDNHGSTGITGQTNSPSELNLPRKDKKVLVVDDDDDVRLVVATRLQRSGYDTAVASNGRDGLRCFYDDPPDLVVLDVSMPEMDGWDVLDRMREVSNLPILMLTAAAKEADKIKGLNRGADDYITKPFSGEEFLARVGATLRRSTTATGTEAIRSSEADRHDSPLSTNSGFDAEQPAGSRADTPDKPVPDANTLPATGESGTPQLPQLSEMGIDVFFNAKHIISNEFDGEIHAHSWRLRAVVLMANDRDDPSVGTEKLRDSLQEVVDEIEGVVLNGIERFRSIEPTPERLVAWLSSKIRLKLNTRAVQLRSTTLWDHPTQYVTTWEQVDFRAV